MRTTRYRTILLALCAGALPCPAQENAIGIAPGTTKVVHTESITDTELLARQQRKPFGGIAPKGTLGRRYDLAAMSDFITFEGYTTLVPKGAILHVPEALRANIANPPDGALLVWKEFLTRNYARITPLEITLEEASGKKPLDQARLDSAMRSGRIIVAVTHGNPTSVSSPQSTTP